MTLQIFDVAHGFCAYVVADTGNVMLLDCGHNAQTGFYPGEYLTHDGCTTIQQLFVLNYDEDHLSGLPHLCRLQPAIPISLLTRNPPCANDL